MWHIQRRYFSWLMHHENCIIHSLLFLFITWRSTSDIIICSLRRSDIFWHWNQYSKFKCKLIVFSSFNNGFFLLLLWSFHTIWCSFSWKCICWNSFRNIIRKLFCAYISLIHRLRRSSAETRNFCYLNVSVKQT